MRIVFLGSGEFGIDCLDALVRSQHSLCLVVTQPASPAGRGRKPCSTPVCCWSQAHSIPFIEAGDINAPEVYNKIAEYQPDLILVIAFSQKIGDDLVRLPPKGAINVHASLLSRYRGAAPINWAIINGETQTGVSIITLAEKMDAGDILAQVQTPIGPEETAGELHDRLAKLAAPLLIDTINKIEKGTATYTPQDHSKATLAPKLKKTDGFLDFTEPAELLARRIRGFWPWPGASADYVSKRTGKTIRVTIAMAEPVILPNSVPLPPGTLDENLNVICGAGALRIKQLKPAGSSLMTFRAFVNGRQTQPGDTFIKIADM
jgi:methionyl-tRNA formyltransferase